MSAYKEALLALAPALYWALDGATKVEDLSGNGHHGTGQGGITLGAHADSPISGEGTSTDFDGIDDRITSTYSPFANGGVRTFVLWSWRDSSETTDTVLGGRLSTGPSFRLMSGGGEGFPRLRMDQSKGAGAGNQVEWSGKAEATGQWLMLALVIDEPNDRARLYVNGELRATKEGLTQAYTEPGSLELGSHGGGNDFFDGKKTSLAIFEKELSAETIAGLYATATAPVEGKATGTGTGTGTAIGPRARVGAAAGTGAGTGTAAGTRTRLGAAAGSGQGTGIAAGEVVKPLLPVKPRRRRKPSLALDIEVETADGTTFRLPTDSRKASRRPRALSFSTQRGDGFGPGGTQLSRAIFKDYPDIGLLDTWRMISKEGDVAYEGRLHSQSRTNDPEEQIDLNLVGWMTYLKSRKVNPVIIDRRLSQWGEPSREYLAKVLGDGRKVFGMQTVPDDKTGLPSIKLALQPPWPKGARSVAVYASPDSPIGSVRYSRQRLGGENLNYQVALTKAADLLEYLAEKNGTIEAPASGSLKAAEAFYAKILLYSEGEKVGSTETADAWNDLYVLGNHGLTPRGKQPDEAFYLTDIAEYILATFYPKIGWAGTQNTFPVEQAAWNDNKASGYEILQQLNNLILWETNVWEGPLLYFEAADLTKYDWQISTDEPGVTALFEGDSIEDFANGVEVTYTDFTGQKRVLYPSDYPELRDDSEENPANRHSEPLWTDAEYPYPCTEAEALQFGRAYLAEFNRPKRPGTYSVEGYILDGAGHWQQGWKPHNGETLGVTNHPDDNPRLIVATTWDDEGKTLRITVDAPDKLLDAVIARHELARQARNLA